MQKGGYLFKPAEDSDLPPEFLLLKAVVNESHRNAAGDGHPVPTLAEQEEARDFIDYLQRGDEDGQV